MSITVSRSEFSRVDVGDPCPDTSYLEQEEFSDRLTEYQRGDFSFIGVRARVTVAIPYGAGAIEHTIESPGLWGIEDDSGDDYLNEVFKEESETLSEMLAALGITVTD